MNRIRDRDVRVWQVAIALLAVGCAARGGDVVHSHRDYADTLCPGAHLYPYLIELRSLVSADEGL